MPIRRTIGGVRRRDSSHRVRRKSRRGFAVETKSVC
jgi:hypothetical protein